MSYRTKKNLTNIGIVILVVLAFTLIVSLFGNVGSKKNTDEFEKVRVKWSVGALENGTFNKMEDTCMVSNYIEIKEGVRIEIKSNKNVTYFISLYDKNNNYLGDFDGGAPILNNTTFTSDEFKAQFTDAVKIRVEMAGMTEGDNHIGFFEKLKYSKYLTIYTTEKEQNVAKTE